jgi:hypothetical protein
MYPFGSLTAELQSARRKLLDVFEVPDSKATGERRTQGMRNGLGRWLYPILEHGTVPAVALALAMAPINSRSLQRHDLTEPTNRGAEMLFSVRTTDTMTLAVRDHEPAVSSTKARPRTAALTVPTAGCISGPSSNELSLGVTQKERSCEGGAAEIHTDKS